MKLLRTYVSDLRQHIGGELPFATALVLFGALLEGVGVLAIVPLIALIAGDAMSGMGNPPLVEQVRASLEMIGAESDLARAGVIAGGFLLLIGLRNLVVWKRDTTLFRLKFAYVDAWRTQLFLAVAKAPWEIVTNLRRTDVEHAINSNVVRLSSGTDVLLRGTISFALVFVYLAVLAVLDPYLLLLAIGLTAAALLLIAPLLRVASQLGYQLTWSGAKKQKVLNQFMTAQKLARTSNAQAEFIALYAQTVTTMRERQLDFNRSQMSARAFFQFGGAVVVTAALLLGYFVFSTPIVLLAMLVLVLARLIAPVENIARLGQQMAHTLPAFDALRRQLDELQQYATESIEPRTEVSGRTGPAKLEVRGVSFRYTNSEIPVLEDISFAVEPGEIVAIRGQSGSGKTTLLDIITGLHVASAGSVLVDNKPLESAQDFARWRDEIAYLPQDPFLIDASVRENLAWLNSGVSDADMWAALEATRAAKIPAIQAQGLDFRTGERGVKLSGGECQRICLARALLRRPRLLILDEATSGLDAETEELVLKRLSGLVSECSMLLVTHREQALAFADKTITIAKSRVVF